MGVYVTIPETLIPTNRGLLRLIFGSLPRSITAADAGDLGHATLPVLDEAAQLGRMRDLVNAVALLRGCGVETHWPFRDTEQVRDRFPEPSVLFNTADVQAYPAPNSLKSAKQLSERIGQATIRVL